MAQQTAKFEFQFVNANVATPVVSQDLAIRALIRKQAMKKASIARRVGGNYGKHNLRQYPIFIDQNDTVTGLWDREKTQIYLDTYDSKPVKGKEQRSHKAERRPEIERQRISRLASVTSLPRSMPAKGYQLTSNRYQFDICDLSTLATLHIGRAVRGALSRNPYHLVHQLRSHKRWSYLSFLPTRYSHVECLKDATDCVIVRSRQIISPEQEWEHVVIASYLKALESLQKALDCPQQRYQPEVLCATEILSLYELLDPSGETAWVRHSQGAAKLILVRGPKSYKTEFEKALFLAMTVPIMTECLLHGEPCFLEQPSWQEVMKSVILVEESPISDRSDIVLSLLMLKCRIPGFSHEVTNMICLNPNPSKTEIEDLSSRLRQHRLNFLDWYARYQSILNDFLPDMSPVSPDYDSHCKVFANYLSCMMITNRLLEAVSDVERPDLEDLTQSLISQMFDLEFEVKDSPTQLFMAQTLAVAQGTRITAEDWREAKPVIVDGQHLDMKGLIERWKLERWFGMFGRKMPS